MRLEFLPLLIICCFCAAQKQISSHIIPPGTARINDSLFIDKTETANVHWREYLYYLLSVKKDTLAYEKALPDTLAWKNDEYGEPLRLTYFRHPAFNFYPVTGVSYEQVVDYCKWRTYMANLAIYLKAKKITDPAYYTGEVFPIHFMYRLPSKEEWEFVASGGIDSTSKTFRKFNKKEKHPYNTLERVTATGGRQNLHTAYLPDVMLSNVQSFYPGKYGIYNMTGNVAEMTAEKGVAKGGSFLDPLDNCKVNMQQNYTGPAIWLGFRCVATLVK